MYWCLATTVAVSNFLDAVFGWTETTVAPSTTYYVVQGTYLGAYALPVNLRSHDGWLAHYFKL